MSFVKKILTIAALIVYTVSPASADVVVLKGPQLQSAAGATFEAPFVVAAAPALGALQLDLLYDATRIDGVTVEPASLLTAAQGGLEFNSATPGRVRIALACSKPIDGDGPLFRLCGTLKNGVDATPVKLKIDAAQAWQAKTLRELRIEPTDGMITPDSAGFNFSKVSPVFWIAAAMGVVVLVLLIVIVRLLKRKS